MNMVTYRRLDALNRIVIPVEMRAKLGIEAGARLSIVWGDGRIRLCVKEEKGTVVRCVDELGRIVLPPAALNAVHIAKEGVAVVACADGEVHLHAQAVVDRACGA